MGKTFTGDLIRKFRKEKGLTQKQLGEKCGINEANIRKYELGNQNPKKETLQKIASALDVTILDLGVINNEFINALKQFEENNVEIFLSGASPEMHKIINYLDELNSNGQQKVLDYTEDLIKIPEYKKE